MDKKKLGKILIILLLTLQPLLIGAKLFDLELRNVDKPLVDMTKLVSGDSITPKAQKASKEEGKSKEKPQEKTVPEKKKNELVIRVSREVIYIDEKARSLDSFETAFEKAYKKGMAVTVTDDYADYKAMVRVTKYLEEKGITYSTGETG